MTDPVSNPVSGQSAAPSLATTLAPRRPRYQQKSRSFWQRVPLSVWTLLPITFASIGWFSFQAWKSSRSVVVFLRADGGAPPQLELQLFREQLSFASPSPPSPYAIRRLESGEDSIVFGPKEVDGSAVLRYSGTGVGVGYATITRGKEHEITLAQPAAADGRVGTTSGIFAMGLRTLGMEAVAGARVIGMGGGEHGVALCETVTDAEGRFRLEGFAADLPSIGIRVLAKGCALAFSNQFVEPGVSVVVPMLPTKPLRGRVTLPIGIEVSGLRVLAKGLPGVEAKLAADGSFEMDHVPPNLEPRLLVHGLPAGFTHAQANAHAGQVDVAIAVVADVEVRGRVVELLRQLPMGGAMVWHDCGPAGGVKVQADSDGRFSIRGAPPGDVLLRAQCAIKTEDGEKETLSGERKLVLEDGKDPGEVVVRIN